MPPFIASAVAVALALITPSVAFFNRGDPSYVARYPYLEVESRRFGQRIAWVSDVIGWCDVDESSNRRASYINARARRYGIRYGSPIARKSSLTRSPPSGFCGVRIPCGLRRTRCYRGFTLVCPP